MMRIARLNMRHHALKKLRRMRFSHDDPPCLFENKEARIKKKRNPEADQTQTALGLTTSSSGLYFKSARAASISGSPQSCWIQVCSVENPTHPQVLFLDLSQPGEL